LNLMIEVAGPLSKRLQQVANHCLIYWSLLPTGDSAETILASSWTELNSSTTKLYSIVLLCTPLVLILIWFPSVLLIYSLEMDPQKSHPLPSNAHMQAHIEKNLLPYMFYWCMRVLRALLERGLL
jgi:hypothetical protein